MSAATIIHALWGATDAKNLSDEQLETLSCNEELSNSLSNTAEVMMGIGSLIEEDGLHASKAGTFQEPDSVAQLLWVLSDVIDTAAAAFFVAGDAKTLLHHRELENKPAGGEKKRATS